MAVISGAIRGPAAPTSRRSSARPASTTCSRRPGLGDKISPVDQPLTLSEAVRTFQRIALQAMGVGFRLHRLAQMRLSWVSGPALTEGVEEHQVVGGTVRVYGVAKTLADCFNFRSKVGLDMALEALREARRETNVSMDDIWRHAVTWRVASAMRPYLEAMW